MSEKNALIICNGSPPKKNLLYRLWDLSEFRVAADGGANFLYSLNLLPDAIVGDLDSLKPEIRKKFSNSILHKIKEQNTNDADKAVRHCLKRGFSKINFVGADGARQDQFLSNLEILFKYTSQARLVLWSPIERMEFVTELWEENLPLGSRISLLPIFGGAKKVLTNGLKFKIDNNSLLPGGTPSGVSNVVESNPVSIKVKNGQILLIIQMTENNFIDFK